MNAASLRCARRARAPLLGDAAIKVAEGLQLLGPADERLGHGSPSPRIAHRVADARRRSEMFNTADVATAHDWPALAALIRANPATRWVSTTPPPVGPERWALRLGVEDFADGTSASASASRPS